MLLSRLCTAHDHVYCFSRILSGGVKRVLINSQVPASGPPLLLRREIGILKKKKTFQPKHKWDKVSPEFSLIYESHLKNWIVGIKASTVMFGVLLVPVSKLLVKASETEAIETVVGVSFILTCFTIVYLFINMKASQYLVRIYYKNDQFIAIHRSIFGRSKLIHYTLNDLKSAAKPDSEREYASVIRLRNRNYIICADDFVNTPYYNLHMGEGLNNFYSGPQF
ncbi:uncharacterized protein LOC131941403 [Physella acuta]|uniref:uncharacterized protein LOC131941403 n=1 Tax=Physella acuta TaxID=109671 RepID=UPI0027DB4F07|nr:uncharacterized protein LOC131941403 [Physella acuta]